MLTTDSAAHSAADESTPDQQKVRALAAEATALLQRDEQELQRLQQERQAAERARKEQQVGLVAVAPEGASTPPIFSCLCRASLNSVHLPWTTALITQTRHTASSYVFMYSYCYVFICACMSVCLSVCLSVGRSVCRSVCLSVYRQKVRQA